MVEQAPPMVSEGERLRMTADVVAAYLRHHPLPMEEVAGVISSVYVALRALEGQGNELGAESLKPAVPIRKSITPDFLVCLEDGKKLKMLKRHLRTAYNMSPGEYRHKWNLPGDYPMVAPNYALQRSAFAKKIGLGRDAGRHNAQRVAAAKK
jgi:predicted transcriptional regulator